MPVSRHLVLATVIGSSDTQVLYPCCVGCYSKLLRDQNQDCWLCCKCGQSYQSDQLEWRYRLALTISDGHSIADICLFGSMLDQFFGSTATQFKRFLVRLESDHGSCDCLLSQAIEQSFMGHSFYFGFKGTVTRQDPPIRGTGTRQDPPIRLGQLESEHHVSHGLGSHMVAFQILSSTSAIQSTVMDLIRFDLANKSSDTGELLTNEKQHLARIDLMLTNEKQHLARNNLMLTNEKQHLARNDLRFGNRSGQDNVTHSLSSLSVCISSFSQETAQLSCDLTNTNLSKSCSTSKCNVNSVKDSPGEFVPVSRTEQFSSVGHVSTGIQDSQDAEKSSSNPTPSGIKRKLTSNRCMESRSNRLDSSGYSSLLKRSANQEDISLVSEMDRSINQFSWNKENIGEDEFHMQDDMGEKIDQFSESLNDSSILLVGDICERKAKMVWDKKPSENLHPPSQENYILSSKSSFENVSYPGKAHRSCFNGTNNICTGGKIKDKKFVNSERLTQSKYKQGMHTTRENPGHGGNTQITLDNNTDTPIHNPTTFPESEDMWAYLTDEEDYEDLLGKFGTSQSKGDDTVTENRSCSSDSDETFDECFDPEFFNSGNHGVDVENRSDETAAGSETKVPGNIDRNNRDIEGVGKLNCNKYEEIEAHTFNDFNSQHSDKEINTTYHEENIKGISDLHEVINECTQTRSEYPRRASSTRNENATSSSGTSINARTAERLDAGSTERLDAGSTERLDATLNSDVSRSNKHVPIHTSHSISPDGHLTHKDNSVNNTNPVGNLLKGLEPDDSEDLGAFLYSTFGDDAVGLSIVQIDGNEKNKEKSDDHLTDKEELCDDCMIEKEITHDCIEDDEKLTAEMDETDNNEKQMRCSADVSDCQDWNDHSEKEHLCTAEDDKEVFGCVLSSNDETLEYFRSMFEDSFEGDESCEVFVRHHDFPTKSSPTSPNPSNVKITNFPKVESKEFQNCTDLDHQDACIFPVQAKHIHDTQSQNGPTPFQHQREDSSLSYPQNNAPNQEIKMSQNESQGFNSSIDLFGCSENVVQCDDTFSQSSICDNIQVAPSEKVKTVQFSRRLSYVKTIQLIDIEMKIRQNPGLSLPVKPKSCLKLQTTSPFSSPCFKPGPQQPKLSKVFSLKKEEKLESQDLFSCSTILESSCDVLNQLSDVAEDADDVLTCDEVFIPGTQDLFTPSPVQMSDSMSSDFILGSASCKRLHSNKFKLPTWTKKPLHCQTLVSTPLDGHNDNFVSDRNEPASLSQSDGNSIAQNSASLFLDSFDELHVTNTTKHISKNLSSPQDFSQNISPVCVRLSTQSKGGNHMHSGEVTVDIGSPELFGTSDISLSGLRSDQKAETKRSATTNYTFPVKRLFLD
ncbi:uncharacterized protein [Argopecten irradians]|uniref:uncharacterized protein n=1 Tax=Argopecten irradians TaxID=31199 RepID=UPI003714F442